MLSAKWIEGKKRLLPYLRGAERDALVAEIDAAERELVAQVAKLDKHGLRANCYPGTCVVTGARVQGGEGYVRQDPTTNRWLTYSRAGAAKAFGV